MKALLFAALMAGAVPLSNPRAACHSACSQCLVRCKQTDNPELCRHTCLELKRQCCSNCDVGGGPRNTCSCS